MKTLISFDVDMTLLDHATYKIPDSAIEAIEALRKNHFIVLATGRDMDTYYSRQYRDQIQADAIIHSNGTNGNFWNGCSILQMNMIWRLA